MKTKKPISELKKLMNKVRKLPQYAKWRSRILYNEFLDNPIPKGTQVHHSHMNFSDYFRIYNINSIEDAIECAPLWKAPGVCMSRGEHFLLTRLALYKYPSVGFVTLLAREFERLQTAMHNKRPEKKRNAKANR